MKRNASLRLIPVFLGLALACLMPRPSNAATLIVSNTSDLVNGDTSTPEALIANPGPDGISFREAMTAINGAPGPHVITFDSSLSGKTIELVSGGMPFITVDGLSVIGLTDANGQPTVTIDASTSPPAGPFTVFASHFLATGLRLTGFRGNGGEAAFSINAGVSGFPLEVSDIRIENNVLDNTGFDDSGHGILIGPPGDAVGAAIRHMWISGNSFIHLTSDVDAINGSTQGEYGIFEDFNIIANTFIEDAVGIETGAEGTHCRYTGLNILGNTFVRCRETITLGGGGGTTLGYPFSTDDLLQGLRIDRNTFADIQSVGIDIAGAGNQCSDSGLVDVQITNNLFAGGPNASHGVGTLAGGMVEAAFNRIQNVSFVNNTFFGPASYIGMDLEIGFPGNSLSGVEISNSLFATPGGDLFDPDEALPTVSHSITDDTRFIGANGNFFADPLFVDAANGNFHLTAGSPAIGKGATAGAPCVDLDGLQRHLAEGRVDIGAYEFGAVFSPRPCPITAVTPPSPAPVKGRS